MRPAKASGVCVSASHPPYRRALVSTFAAEKSCPVAPYPEANGEPKSVRLIQAIVRQASTTGIEKATNERKRSRRCSSARGHSIHMPSTAASGTRFGRIRIAIAAATPATTVFQRHLSSAFHVATAQNAAAGTSLIGSFVIVRNAGLVATSHAAPTPRDEEPSWRPIANVDQINNAAARGTTTNIAACPPIPLNSAMSSGRPGPTADAIAEPSATAA